MTTVEPATSECFPGFPIAPADTPLSGTYAWLTEKPHPGFATSVTAGYRRLLDGNLLNAQGNFECLPETGIRSRSWNLYGYAWNNPLKFVDPSGLCSVDSSGNYYDDDNEGTTLINAGPCPTDNGALNNHSGSSVTVTGISPSVTYDLSGFADQNFLGALSFNYGPAVTGSYGPTITGTGPAFPAPNNGTPTVSHCLAVAAEDKGGLYWPGHSWVYSSRWQCGVSRCWNCSGRDRSQSHNHKSSFRCWFRDIRSLWKRYGWA